MCACVCARAVVCECVCVCVCARTHTHASEGAVHGVVLAIVVLSAWRPDAGLVRPLAVAQGGHRKGHRRSRTPRYRVAVGASLGFGGVCVGERGVCVCVCARARGCVWVRGGGARVVAE